MAKRRKRILSKDDISDIIEILQINSSLTKREVANKYQVALSTLYKYLPPYLKSYKNFPKYKMKGICNPGG